MSKFNTELRIPAVEEFLENWKKEAFEYYTKLREEKYEVQKTKYEVNYENLKIIKDWYGCQLYSDKKINEILEEYNNPTTLENTKKLTEKHVQKGQYTKWVNKVGASTVAFLEAAFSDKELERLLTKEVDAKRNNLISRVEKKIGTITDAKGLFIGANLELNGVIIGEQGSCRVETIFAGGYNIQCLHFRVLIKSL